MAEYFVDAANGDDANRGSSAQPVRTISRAIALIPDEVGRIILRAGTYSTTEETTPLLIPPGYSLEGADTDATEIRVTGGLRLSDGGIIVDPDATDPAIMVGSALRNLTVRAHPTSDSHVLGIGVRAIVEGSVIESVNIFAPELPEIQRELDSPKELARGFLTALVIDASDVVCRNCRISHQSAVNVSSARNTVVDRLRLETGRLDLRGDVQVRNSEIIQEWVWDSRGGVRNPPASVSISNGSPTFGPNNYVDYGGRNALIHCWSRATPTITGNVLVPFDSSNGIVVADGAVVRMLGNMLADNIHIEIDAGANSFFENNLFYAVGTRSGGMVASEVFRVEAPADFGGGPAGSIGMNDFGPLLFYERQNWIVPGGGTIHADNCQWPEGGPGSIIRTGPWTTLTNNNARISTLNSRDGRRLWRSAHRPRNDGFLR